MQIGRRFGLAGSSGSGAVVSLTAALPSQLVLTAVPYPQGVGSTKRAPEASIPEARRPVVECSSGHVDSVQRGVAHHVRALIALVVIFFIATFPATWLLMLFLGNVGLSVSYWGSLPLGILVSLLLSGAPRRRPSPQWSPAEARVMKSTRR